MTLLLLLSMAVGVAHPDPEFARLRAEADAVMQRDPHDARPFVGLVFQVADRLADDGQLADADTYYEAGLKLDSYDYAHHLKYAQVLAQQHQTDKANEQAKFILRDCEDYDLILKAQDVLGQPHIQVTPLETNLTKLEPLIVLIPLDKDIDLTLLQDEQAKLQEELGIKVLVRSLKVEMPDYARYGPEGALDLQWSADAILSNLTDATKTYEDFNVGFIGVTNHDIFAKDLNFTFGWSIGHHRVVSYRRFLASFNGDAIPQHQRLLKRFNIQLLSSARHIWGIPDCDDSSCSLSHVDSVDDMDAASGDLCDKCKDNFSAAFRRVRMVGSIMGVILIGFVVAPMALVGYVARKQNAKPFEAALFGLGIGFLLITAVSIGAPPEGFDYPGLGPTTTVFAATLGIAMWVVGGLSGYHRRKNGDPEDEEDAENQDQANVEENGEEVSVAGESSEPSEPPSPQV